MKTWKSVQCVLLLFLASSAQTSMDWRLLCTGRIMDVSFPALSFPGTKRPYSQLSTLYGRRGNGWQSTVAASSLLHGDFEQRHWPVLSHWASTLRTARCAHVASPTGLSIGYWFSVNRATSAFNISADFLIAINVLFNFHFKRTLVI